MFVIFIFYLTLCKNIFNHFSSLRLRYYRFIWLIIKNDLWFTSVLFISFYFGPEFIQVAFSFGCLILRYFVLLCFSPFFLKQYLSLLFKFLKLVDDIFAPPQVANSFLAFTAYTLPIDLSRLLCVKLLLIFYLFQELLLLL